VIGSQQWTRYKPFAASESVINFSPATRRDGNMDLAMESNVFDCPADYKGTAVMPQYMTQLKQINSSREVTFQRRETRERSEHEC
jgi:hypothetical protein